MMVVEDEAGLDRVRRPVGLRRGQSLREQGQHQLRGELVFGEWIAVGIESLIAAKLAHGRPPVARRRAGHVEHSAVDSPAGVAQQHQLGRGDQQRRIVRGEEGAGRKDRRNPPQVELLRNQRGGVDHLSGDHQVGVDSGGEQVVKGIAKVRKDELAKENFRAAAQVFALRDQCRVGRIPVRAQGVERESKSLDPGTVKLGCGDGDRVAAPLELKRHAQAWMEIAQRANGSEENPLQ